jgi:hypothetical protein
VNSAVKRGNESTHVFSLNDAGNQDLEELARLLLRILSLSKDNLGSEIKVAASMKGGRPCPPIWRLAAAVIFPPNFLEFFSFHFGGNPM